MFLVVHRSIMVHHHRTDTQSYQPVFEVGILTRTGMDVTLIESVGFKKVGLEHGKIAAQYPLVSLVDEPSAQGRGGHPNTVLHVFLPPEYAGTKQRPDQLPLEIRSGHPRSRHAFGNTGRKVHASARNDEPFPARPIMFLH